MHLKIKVSPVCLYTHSAKTDKLNRIVAVQVSDTTGADRSTTGREKKYFTSN
jgi:hypothetical protein